MKHTMMVYMSRRMIACDEASYLVSLQHDKDLGFRQKMQLRIHLMTCHLCRKYAAQIGQLHHVMEQYRHHCDSPACNHHMTEVREQEMQQVLEREINAK